MILPLSVCMSVCLLFKKLRTDFDEIFGGACRGPNRGCRAHMTGTIYHATTDDLMSSN